MLTLEVDAPDASVPAVPLLPMSPWTTAPSSPTSSSSPTWATAPSSPEWPALPTMPTTPVMTQALLSARQKVLERNRACSAKTRERQKEHVLALEARVAEIEQENASLRAMVEQGLLENERLKHAETDVGV